MTGPSPRLRIIAGKGGVGRTLVATTLALAESRAGRRVLLAEVQGHDRVASLLQQKPVGSHMREVLHNLFVVDMNPEDSIREYALLTVHFEAIYKAVFQNKMVKHFLRFIPSLSEMVMLGKIWYHEQERIGDKAKFDVIILDAPATGHLISMLQTPSTIERLLPRSPMHHNAKIIRELLCDANRTVLHITTTSEEMPVNEAIRIERAAREDLGIKLGATIINKVISQVPKDAITHLETTSHNSHASAALRILERRVRQHANSEYQIQRLPAHIQSNTIRLPRLLSQPLGLDDVSQLTSYFKPAIKRES